MKKIHVFLIASIVATNYSCAAQDASPRAEDRSRFVQFENPEAQALNAFNGGDCRLLGIRGYSVTFPGVDILRSEAVSMYGYRIVDGVKEISQSPIDDYYRSAAVDYAFSYNKKIFELSSTRSLSGCRNHGA